MKGILIDPKENEFLAVIKDVEKFIKAIMSIDRDTWTKLPEDEQEKRWKESYEMIRGLNDEIDDIDIYNACSVVINKWSSTEQYKNDLFDIEIFGDDGLIEFQIQTKPNTI